MKSVPYYPMMYVAPDGRVFMAGPGVRGWWLSTDGTGWVDGGAESAILISRDYGRR